MDRRDYVIPDDIQALAPPVLAHRIIATPQAKLAGITPTDTINSVLASTRLPQGRA